VQNVSFGFDKLNVLSISPDAKVRHCHGITKIALSIVASVRSDDNVLGYDVPELIRNGVWSVLIQSTETDKVSLIDCLHTGQMIKAAVQNLCNFALIEEVNLLMIVGDTDFLFVENCLGSYKELTVSRILTPYNCRGTINLDGQIARFNEPIQNGKVTRQDGIFGVFEVCVFHNVIIAQDPT
jgi:hypothetical protein